MERFQQTAIEQDDDVNGYSTPASPRDEVDVKWTPPKVKTEYSNSCAGTVSKPTDLQGLKSPESRDEEAKEEEEEEVLPTKGLRGDQKKSQREGQDEENNHNKKNNSAASSYTGKERRFNLDTHWMCYY